QGDLSSFPTRRSSDLDFHPANVLGANADVVIDWAYCGLGAVGLDAGVLVADGVADEVFPAELADAVCSAVWRGYLARPPSTQRRDRKSTRLNSSHVAI